MLANKLMSALSGGAEDKLYVDDVFSAYTYTGNGATQTINNGIDLAGKGGLVWAKRRSTTNNHELVDTQRGATKRLYSSLTNAEDSNGSLSGFTSTGFSLSSSGGANATSETYVSWTFRKSPKFFDVVTYTGNGVAGRQIPHALGIAPGMVIVKRIDSNVSYPHWYVYHSALGNTQAGFLNLTDAFSTIGYWPSAPTSTDFTTAINAAGASFVAYLFAHDPSADGIIQCGSFTTDGSGNATVNLGWEPQYILFKRTDSISDWSLLDSSRGFNMSTYHALYPNTSGADSVQTPAYITPTATGFKFNSPRGPTTSTEIYLAIRRPNKPPTTGTEVYNAIARTGTGTTATVTGVGFAPDLVITLERPYNYQDAVYFSDKLRGYPLLLLDSKRASAEYDPVVPASWGMDGFNLPSTRLNYPTPYVHYFFKRAPGFMDVVCYTGTGVARTVPHNLGAVPELMIVKVRNIANYSWIVYHSALGATKCMLLQSIDAPHTISDYWNNTSPTITVFTVGTDAAVNNLSISGAYVAYLFASLPGISKVGSYTGNGTTQTIDCGFATGARFILIKRTDSTGDWYVWDTARGIISANDPHLSLNTTAAEVTTDDSVDPDTSGFIVNQVAATNINVSGGSYIFLAIA